MNLKKMVAKAAAVLIIATSIPVFAASTNGVNKVVTVREGSTIEEAAAPELGIELQDDLEKGQYFYLDLENAEWKSDVVSDLKLHPSFTFEREGKKRLLVQAKKNLVASKSVYKIPLMAKITGTEAKVEIVSNGTVVTSGKYAFANAVEAQSIVTAEPKVFAELGEMGKISIEEQYPGAFKSNRPQSLTIEIVSKGFEFNHSNGHIIKNALKGTRSYANKAFDAKVLDSSTIEVEIPANSLDESQRGLLELSGIKLKATRDAAYGDIIVKVRGNLNEATDVVVAKYEDYETELTVAEKYEVTAGQQLKDIEFTLGEVLPDSLYGNKELTFNFTEGITIEALAITKTQGLQVGAPEPVLTVVKKNDNNTNTFRVANIVADNAKKTAVTFKATLRVPTTFTGDIHITADGRSLEEAKDALIAKVETPIKVTVSPITAKVGLADQEGGKIVITETSKGKLLPGKLFLTFADDIINYRQAPKVKVLEGNIKVEPEATIVEGGLEITINSTSREAAVIEVSGGKFSVPGLVPEGTYQMRVGGPSISAYSSNAIWDTAKARFNDIDAITEQDFVYLGKEVTSNKAIFTIGKTTYSVNGVNKPMDTAAYLAKEGRTMLPVRYVADALGIPANQILWDKKDKVVTILVNKDNTLDKMIRIELNKKEIVINNMTTQMTAAAEMKDSRVFVPVAEIARALGSHVEWNEITKTATFN